MKKRRRLKLKIRTFITFIIAIVLFGYVSFGVINYSIFKKKYENEEKILEKKLYELKDQETDLNQEINKLKDDDYLARYAREEYLYSKDGEYVIKIEEKANEELPSEDETVKVPEYVIILNVLIFATIITATVLIALKNRKLKKVPTNMKLVS